MPRLSVVGSTGGDLRFVGDRTSAGVPAWASTARAVVIVRVGVSIDFDLRPGRTVFHVWLLLDGAKPEVRSAERRDYARRHGLG